MHQLLVLLVEVLLLVHLVEPVEPLVGVGGRLVDVRAGDEALLEGELAVVPPGVVLDFVEVGLVVEGAFGGGLDGGLLFLVLVLDDAEAVPEVEGGLEFAADAGLDAGASGVDDEGDFLLGETVLLFG